MAVDALQMALKVGVGATESNKILYGAGGVSFEEYLG